jgi:hypothetical protein
MLSMVAQLLVPGAQIVTLVVSILRVSPGAAVTAIGCTFGVVDCPTAAGALAGVVGVFVEPDAAAGAAAPLAALPPPPPQAASTLQSTLERKRKKTRWVLMAGSFMADRQG